MCECACMTAKLGRTYPSTEEFASLRSKCLALTTIYVPDETWDEFRGVVKKKMCGTQHASVLHLAADRGYLNMLTGPVHRFLLGSFAEGRSISPAYAQELRELWMLLESDVDRHGRGTRYRGKLTELQVAAHLEAQGWDIRDLAALASKENVQKRPDIEVVMPSGSCASIEVKFIGLSPEAFAEQARTGGFWVDTRDRVNYLLGGIYTAAKQLEGLPGKHLACVALSRDAWHLEYKPLVGNIKWGDAAFLECPPKSRWHGRHKRLRKRYASIDEDLSRVIRELDGILLLWFDERFGLHGVIEGDLSAA